MPRQSDPMKFHRPSRRWRRFIKDDPRSPYIVSCKFFGVGTDVSDAEAERLTRPRMLEWWSENGPQEAPAERINAALAGRSVAELRRMVAQGQVAERVVQVLAGRTNPVIEPEDVENVGDGIFPDVHATPRLAADIVEAVMVPVSQAPKGKSIKEARHRFVELWKTRHAVTSNNELRRCLMSLSKLADDRGVIFADNADVKMIKSETVERMYQAIGRNEEWATERHKGKVFGMFKRFVKWMGRNELIVTPLNIDDTIFGFEKETTEVTEFDLEFVRQTLADLPERFRLWSLLALNAGMTQVDIGLLRHDMLEGPYLTRRREKTGKRRKQNRKAEARTPTVEYLLWPEVMELLGTFRSKHPELILLSERGVTLYSHSPKRDIISDRWIRQGPKGIWFTAWRSIGATLVSRCPFAKAGDEDFYLANAPASITLKHYVAPDVGQFQKITGWVHDQIFPLPAPTSIAAESDLIARIDLIDWSKVQAMFLEVRAAGRTPSSGPFTEIERHFTETAIPTKELLVRFFESSGTIDEWITAFPIDRNS